jgi:hypothetical protein
MLSALGNIEKGGDEAVLRFRVFFFGGGGIIHVLDSTNGTVWTAFSCRMLIGLSVMSVYFCSLSVMVLRRLVPTGTSTFVKYAYLMVTLSTAAYSLLSWSVILDRS